MFSKSAFFRYPCYLGGGENCVLEDAFMLYERYLMHVVFLISLISVVVLCYVLYLNYVRRCFAIIFVNGIRARIRIVSLKKRWKGLGLIVGNE